MAVTGLVPMVVTAKLVDTGNLYVPHLGSPGVFQDHWCDQLHGARAGGLPAGELAFMLPDGADQPAPVHAVPTGSGVIQALEGDDADALDARLSDAGTQRNRIVALRDERLGQRHFLFRGPAGALVDVGQQIPPASEHAASCSADEESER